MEDDPEELVTDLLGVESVEQLRLRRSVKWRLFPDDVLPLTVAEMDFALAPAVKAVLREAVERSDSGYAMPDPKLGEAIAGFAARRWNWHLDPSSVTAVADVGVGVVELLRALTRPGDAVVISPPVYPPFFGWAPEAGARILEAPLVEREQGWRLDLVALERVFATRASRGDEFGPVASVTISWRMIDQRIYAHHLLGVKKVRSAAREEVWAAGGAPQVDTTLVIDVDATISLTVALPPQPAWRP